MEEALPAARTAPMRVEELSLHAARAAINLTASVGLTESAKGLG